MNAGGYKDKASHPGLVFMKRATPDEKRRVKFRNSPTLQEKMFAGFTVNNHLSLRNNRKYKSKSF